MQLMTQYLTEKEWIRTTMKDALRIVAEEVGEDDPQGVLDYILEATAKGGVITVGSCRFRQEKR